MEKNWAGGKSRSRTTIQRIQATPDCERWQPAGETKRSDGWGRWGAEDSEGACGNPGGVSRTPCGLSKPRGVTHSAQAEVRIPFPHPTTTFESYCVPGSSGEAREAHSLREARPRLTIASQKFIYFTLAELPFLSCHGPTALRRIPYATYMSISRRPFLSGSEATLPRMGSQPRSTGKPAVINT